MGRASRQQAESREAWQQHQLPGWIFPAHPGTFLLEGQDLDNASAVEQENKSSFLFGALAQSSGTSKLFKYCMGVQHVTPIKVNMSHVANNPSNTLKIYCNLCFSHPRLKKKKRKTAVVRAFKDNIFVCS